MIFPTRPIEHEAKPPTLLVAAVACVLLLACCDSGGTEFQPAPEERTDGSIAFPEGFLFGAATAGFQVDMGCPTLPPGQCDDPFSDWYGYVTSPDVRERPLTHVTGRDPSIVGPGHWELYETDFDLAARELNHNAFRMSIEWSRIFPASTVGVDGYENLRDVANHEALAHYHAVFAALKERGLTPVVTLNHYTLPNWIHDGVECTLDPKGCWPRGWADPVTTVHEIAKYAGFCAREFGATVDLWATQNEPSAVFLPGYLFPTSTRTNPPSALFRVNDFFTAYGAMVEAHARMTDAIRANDYGDADGDGDASSVGLVFAVAPVKPDDPDDPLDVLAAENVFYLWNEAFLNAVALGVFDARLDRNAVYREDLAGRLDWLGVNYKVRINVAGLPGPILPDLFPLITFDPLSLSFTEVYPRGLYEMLALMQERYGVPMIVTENNGQSVPKGDIETEIRYLVENLTWTALAAADGIDVRGFIYWSLMDNYEWNHGMTIDLGLYAVDPDDPAKRRYARETVPVYSAIAGAGAIPADFAAAYPVQRP